MNENIFYLSMVDAFKDAFKDCIGIIPFLLVVFYIIEIIEYFYSDKVASFSRFSKKLGPFLGAILASIPQCGLSVAASTLYCKRLITKGTLIGIYLATSDEAIPVLLSKPEGYKALIPLIFIKIFTGIIAGYLIDFILPSKLGSKHALNIKIDKGCHSHSLSGENKIEIFVHPLIHTLSVTFFIFIVTLLINLCVSDVFFDIKNYTFMKNDFLQPVFTAIAGLIPNCAISVGITVLYLKGILSFASCVSGLCSSAGLGILVLVKNNNSRKDTLNIISLLLLVSIIAGMGCILIN